MQPLNNQFRRSESEVILKALDEQMVAHRVESNVAAEVAYWQGELHRRFYEADEALENYRLAIEIHRQVGDRLGQANCLQELGNLEEDIETKLQFLQDAQQLYVAINDRYSQSRNLRFIAPAQESQGNLAAALTSWTASRDLAIEINYESFQTLAQEEIDRLSATQTD